MDTANISESNQHVNGKSVEFKIIEGMITFVEYTLFFNYRSLIKDWNPFWKKKKNFLECQHAESGWT